MAQATRTISTMNIIYIKQRIYSLFNASGHGARKMPFGKQITRDRTALTPEL